MAPLQVSFVERGSAIEIVGNLESGWWPRCGTHAFREIDKLNVASLEARIHLHVFTSPYKCSLPDFPELPQCSGSHRGIEWELRGTKLKMRVRLYQLELLHRELTRARNLKCEWVHRLGQAVNYQYTAKLLLVFARTGGVQPGNIREWDTQFWQGGLPSLGKNAR